MAGVNRKSFQAGGLITMIERILVKEAAQ